MRLNMAQVGMTQALGATYGGLFQFGGDDHSAVSAF
jgi:hypothetical protein